ncbi:MAG: sigma-70 family RNA polymerase sigma factor [Lachnospiraceae bacterium]|nr:sigma-70 family RNA polymerase sigma factor [Lachnospiraceae bacterium]
MEDKEIIELYWSRDSSAITVSAEHYGNYCRQIAWNILQNHEDCEECINETWFRAWNAMPDARPNSLKSFLGAITRRLSLDYYRKSHAEKRGRGEISAIYDELQTCIPDSAAAAASKNSKGSDNNVERHLEHLALTAALNSFLSQLDSTSRILFIRRYWYSDSIRELAQNLHLNENRIKSTLFRTRKKLKKHLEKEGIVL